MNPQQSPSLKGIVTQDTASENTPDLTLGGPPNVGLNTAFEHQNPEEPNFQTSTPSFLTSSPAPATIEEVSSLPLDSASDLTPSQPAISVSFSDLLAANSFADSSAKSFPAPEVDS